MMRSRPMIMSHQRGFSLVELMVALTLSLVLMAGALSVLYSSRLSYRENDRIARLQEAGRTAVELLLRDARPAGYIGCSRPVFGDEFSNGLAGGTSLLTNFTDPVAGFEAGASDWTPALDTGLIPSATAGSDVLVLRSTRQGQPVFRTNTPVVNTATALSVDRSVGTSVPANTPMIISDCQGSAVFMATAFTGAGATATIEHIAGANASANLARGFDTGALVMPVQTIIYYVRDASDGSGPALWQRVDGADPVELIGGVENLQVLYGVDTDNDLLANDYRSAATVTNWQQVISLSVALLIRSTETGVERDNRVYTLLDGTVGPFNDRRQRSVFTTTVVLRNRTS
jgi:type IV pilus assembly protein PilW